MYDLLNSPKFRNFDQRLNTPHIMSPSRFTPAALPTGGWVELGRTTLGSANADVGVASLADKRYYMVLFDQTAGQSASADPFFRFNTDTGSNYAGRVSDTGGADAPTTSQSDARIGGHPAGTTGNFGVGYVSNLLAKEKLAFFHEVGQGTLGATTAPYRAEGAIKWANTAAAVNDIIITSSTAATWSTGTQIVVLGWDPADTHTTNFWTELASVQAGGASTNLSSGTIEAKKYLWIQAYTESNSAHVSNMTFNNDATTYSYRTSDDDGVDATATSAAFIPINQSTSTGVFTNMFIINNSAKEKLVTGHSALMGTAGAAAAPSRSEFVGKYNNTAAQITEIDIDSSSGNYTTSSIIKVWGSN